MRARGCEPRGFPPEGAGVYDAESVHTWADELSASCERFAGDLLEVDCADSPCLLFVRPQEVTLEEEALVRTPTPDWSDALTCGETEGPNLRWIGAGFGTMSEVQMIAVTTEADFDVTAWMRSMERYRYRYLDEAP